MFSVFLHVLIFLLAVEEKFGVVFKVKNYHMGLPTARNEIEENDDKLKMIQKSLRLC